MIESARKHAARDWFASRGWKPFKFQREVWAAITAGRSGLLHATTGSGKTYAVWLGALQAFGAGAQAASASPAAKTEAKTAKAGRVRSASTTAPPLTVLWITPMRALAADTLRALIEPLAALQPNWSAGARSGDTVAKERAAQSRRLPTALVITPESLSLLLARADAREVLRTVRMVVVDEWHELIGNKRGVQVQLALARLETFNPGLCIWGMSATLGNLDEAMQVLLGPGPRAQAGVLVRGETPKKLKIDMLLPKRIERFPWAGQLGLRMLPQVVDEIAASNSALIFTNTRGQCEQWFQALLDARPDWAGQIALHHGSLDRGVREWVELALKNGDLRAVVCTSSLDLGVDFAPVERVLQIGSAKGVARLLQRAGRSGHSPGRPSRITLVPTHSIEIAEGPAMRMAVEAGAIESRSSPQEPLDVLVQHLVTVALGGGFEPDELLPEVRGTAAYANLSDENWQWSLDFVRQGGKSLAAYPDYHRALPDQAGVWRVPDARLARRHRMNIGTIVSDASMAVQVVGGARLGNVEESFAARLKPGDCFVFAGRFLELVRIHEMTAWVRRASAQRPAMPRWSGTKLPLSMTLADALLQQFGLADAGRWDSSAELACIRPLLDVQRRWSALPTPQVLLAESVQSREGFHLFLYPFAGRHAHLGLASLVAWRLAQHAPRTFSIAVNDHGFELLCAEPVDWAALLPDALFADRDDATLLHEVLDSLNASELARRRFREIARISGLIFQGHPGERRSNKQLQASSSLFWEVFTKYDPANKLLTQAEQELLSQELDIGRLKLCFARMAGQQLVLKTPARPTPFGFPLLVERYREQLSNEKVADRIARMVAELEQDAGLAPGDLKGMPKTAEDVVAQVRSTLDFGRESGSGSGDVTRTRPRRERRPSRPLPPL